MNIIIKSKKQNTYDAIVVGTGISGGWAAKELTEKGLKTLVLERGRMVRHGDYPTATMDPWEFPYNNQPTQEEVASHPVQRRARFTMRQDIKHWWVNDLENPYTETKRFDWIRGYHVGGRSIMWGRISLRYSDIDFAANAKDGIGVDWPIRYSDIAPWYDYVESYVGVSGLAEGLKQLPDGKFLPPMDLTCIEQHARKKIAEKFKGRILTIGRAAHLTQKHLGRGPCQFRDLCMRGCPYSGYFSSVSSTLISAEKTGNMTLRPDSIVSEVIYDESTGKASGVRVVDANTKEAVEYFSKIIFLNASTLGSAFILLNSKSNRFPNGLGNDSGELGHNLMDHHFRAGASAETDDWSDTYYSGRRPNGFYIPRFRNIGNDKRDYLRGFGYEGGSGRNGWIRAVKELAVGPELKELIATPGNWRIGMTAFGECLPYHSNKIMINTGKKDVYGLPTLTVDCEFKENEMKMRVDMTNDAAEMLEACGFKNVNRHDDIGAPGLGIHEMGTARMGHNPETSVLNKWNQVHSVPNVFVTDGAAMSSSPCQNPSLTYMAITARAANFAVEELKKRNL